MMINRHWFIDVVILCLAVVALVYFSGREYMAGYEYGVDSGIEMAKKHIKYLAREPWKKWDYGNKVKALGCSGPTCERDLYSHRPSGPAAPSLGLSLNVSPTPVSFVPAPVPSTSPAPPDGLR